MIRFYRAVLRLYPSSFRAEYGEEMTAAFVHACAAAGPVGKVGLLLRTLADEVLNALAVHRAILVQDLRYTARTLGRARGFAITAILVVAVGVGANTAAFSVADFVLLRPLPFPDADSLVRLCEGPRTGGGWGCNNQLSPANYRDFKTMSSSFASLGAFAVDAVNLVGGGEPRRLAISPLTPEVLPVLGVQPLLGRVFGPGEQDERTVVLSYGLWRSQFGGDPGVLGRTVNLNGAPFTVIGVMPRSFFFPSREYELWRVLTFSAEDYEDRGNSYIEGVGRLKPGVTFEQARAELGALAARLSEQHPDTNEDTGISFYKTRDNMAPRFRIMLLALGGASVCLLLLTCANLANLLLARASARAREFAVRAALGAGKERLVRQMITETLTLTALGGAGGVLIAVAGVPLFSSLVPPTLPIDTQPSIDLRVFAFAALFTVLTGLGFGLFPALRAGGRTSFDALREGRGTGAAVKHRLRAVLVTVEITMSVILLIMSGLLLRAVWRVQAVDPGFVADNVLTIRTALPRPKYEDPARRGQFYDQVLEDVRVLPGVRSAAYVSGLPMQMIGGVGSVQVAGQPIRRGWDAIVSRRFVTSQYFAAMGIPLLAGRDIEDGDTAERAWVAVVSQSFVDRYWPGQDPIGRSFLYADRLRTVVGVVGDVKVRGLERTTEPQMYLPARQVAGPMFPAYDPKELLIRHEGQGMALLPAVRQIVRAADPEQPVSHIRHVDELVAGETAPRRAQLQVLAALATVALLLAGIGIHGLLAYMVSQRSQEIGVRLALGAERSRVARMVLSDGMRLAALGILLGVPGAYLAARGMSTLLFGLEPGDPVTVAAALVLALTMAFVGSLVPAIRALRVDPMSAMRAE
jgi:putative ABC transport system permease protein